MSFGLERRPPGRARELLRELALADFRMKYEDSALGYAWSMLSPALMLAIYYFVFRHVVGVTTPGYLVYLVVGIVYWTFFQDCSFAGLNALTGKAGVLKSIAVPPGLIVGGGVLSTFITLGINSGVLVVALLLAGRLSPLAPLALLPIACLGLLATGTSYLVALAHVHFRDTGLIWGILLQALFWLTPVVYVVDGPLAELLYLNPVARCLYLIRWFLVYSYFPAPRFILLTVLASSLVFAAGLFAFQRRSRLLPELL
jgi:ABC-type polysaccharide/polyol phosphate export permease